MSRAVAGARTRVRAASAAFEIWVEGARLVTSPDGVAELDSEHLEPEVERWARETRFDRAVVVGIQVGSSGESSPIEVLGVERDGERTVDVHSWIEQRGASDDLEPYAQDLRVAYGEEKPTKATLTHHETGETHVFD